MATDEYGAVPMVEVTLGHRHRPSHKTDFAANPGTAVTANRQLSVSGDARTIIGYACAETTGAAAAAFRLRDGNSAAAEVILRINLTANESTRDWFAPFGIVVSTGHVFLEFLSGSFEGVLYWK